MSYPWPEQWLEECRAAYQIDSPEAVQKSIWVQVLMAEAKSGSRVFWKELRKTENGGKPWRTVSV